MSSYLGSTNAKIKLVPADASSTIEVLDQVSPGHESSIFTDEISQAVLEQDEEILKEVLAKIQDNSDLDVATRVEVLEDLINAVITQGVDDARLLPEMQTKLATVVENIRKEYLSEMSNGTKCATIEFLVSADTPNFSHLAFARETDAHSRPYEMFYEELDSRIISEIKDLLIHNENILSLQQAADQGSEEERILYAQVLVDEMCAIMGVEAPILEYSDDFTQGYLYSRQDNKAFLTLSDDFFSVHEIASPSISIRQNALEIARHAFRDALGSAYAEVYLNFVPQGPRLVGEVPNDQVIQSQGKLYFWASALSPDSYGHFAAATFSLPQRDVAEFVQQVLGDGSVEPAPENILRLAA